MKSLNSSILLDELMERYVSLDLNNPDEVVSFIHKMNTSEKFIPKKVAKAIAIDLRKKGVVSYKEYEKKHNYMERYNSADQYYFLNDNKEEIAGNLLSRYMSSLEFYGKSNIFVKYLTNIYRTRFIENKDKNKIEILRSMPTFKQYAKTR